MGVVMRRAVAAGAALVLVAGVVPLVSAVGAGVAVAADGGAVPCDFDGDGYADLAVGVPFEDLRGAKDAGAVQVLYGSASGVTARDQLWHQGRKGVKGALEKNDRFGEALACGDFDADGRADLAVGVPYEDVGSVRDAGIVQVLYGSSRRLTARDQIWHRGKPGVPGSNDQGGGFGGAVATGDFDADGYADLAIQSSPGVLVLRGGPRGLTSSGALTVQFGRELAVGDVNGDGRDDLAVGADQQAGSGVYLLLGSPTGLTSAGMQYVLASDIGVGVDDRFKLTLADFDRDAHDDLVLASGEGWAAVLHGHADGLHPAVLPAAADAAPGVDALWPAPWGDEDYGVPVAAGDLTGDGFPDLAVGARVILGTSGGLGSASMDWPVDWDPYGDLAVLPFSGGGHAWLAVPNAGLPLYPSDREGAGVVTVLRGDASGNPDPAVVWSQDSKGVKGAAEYGDNFGWSVGGGAGHIA